MRITLLGTGLMGLPMARRLADAGYDLTVWNRTAETAAPLRDHALVAGTAAGAVSGADLVVAMLRGAGPTRAVLERDGVIAAMSEGAILVNMATTDPATDRELAGLAAARGIGFLDAPVSGGTVGARKGTLSIYAGGAAEVLERARPVLSVLGRPTLMGPVGAGQATKLANQTIVATTIGAVAEGLRLAEAAGCDPATVREALSGGFADSRILHEHGARMVAGDYAPGGRSAAQLADLVSARALAQEVGLHMPLAITVEDAFRDLVEARGGADMDHSAYHHWLTLEKDTP